MTWLYVPNLPSSPGSPSAPESGDSNSDSALHWEMPIAVVCTSRGTLSPRPSSWRGWKTRSWIRLLSGTISQPSTAARGVESWISSPRASRANPGRKPEGERGPLTTGGSGPISRTSFATWDRDGSSWRTYPDLLGEGWNTYSATWPKRGSMRNGTCSALATPARPTSGNASSSWPTPDANVTTRTNRSPSPGAANRPALAALAQQWPTPMSSDGTRGSMVHIRGNPTLFGEARLWATPMAMDSRSSGMGQMAGRSLTDMTARSWPTPTSTDNKRSVPDTRGRNQGPTLASEVFRSFPHTQETATTGKPSRGSGWVLNPRFVEWLMGFPLNWTIPIPCSGSTPGSPSALTACEPLGTEWSQWWRRQRSLLFALVLEIHHD